MRNAAMAYTSSASTDVVAYEDLPGHHLLAARKLIATTNDESYHSSASELPPGTSHGYAEWDFSCVPDPVMFQRFLDAANYWFGYSDNYSAGSYDPAHECFVVVVDDQANGANVAGAGDGEAPQSPGTRLPQSAGPSAPPTSPAGGADINAQLAQARELEAKVAKKYRAVRLLCASIAGEASARGEHARELGKQARECINADFDVNNSSTPPRASQKLITATTLLRAMPAPLTPEAQNLHREVQALIEQAAVQQAESSASRIRQQGSARDDGGAQSPEASVHAGGVTRHPPTKAGHRSGSGSLTREGRPRTATLATSSTPGERATRRHGRRQATTHGGVGATIAVRTAHRRRSRRGPACSARRSARRASRSASASPRPSTSTRGRRTPVYGSTTIAWHANWEPAATCRYIIRNLPLHLADSA
jgi:hypothetical protein